MMHSDEIRFPDGPEEEPRSNAWVRVECHDCRIAAVAQLDGWDCPECGQEMELEDLDVEQFREREFVAAPAGHPELYAVGETSSEATEKLYEAAKAYAPGPKNEEGSA